MTPSATSPITAQVSSLPGNEALDHDMVAIDLALLEDHGGRPVRAAASRYERRRSILPPLASARRARASDGCAAASSSVDQLAFGHRNAGGAENRLRLFLVHGERRSEHARMRIGNLQRLEDRRHAAVLAPLAVQRIEGDIGFEVGRTARDRRASHRSAITLKPALRKRSRTGLARRQADLALGRPAAHQHGNHAFPRDPLRHRCDLPRQRRCA